MVWTCPQTPRLISALQQAGARLRCLDLNAFLLDPGSAAALGAVSSLRSLSLYFDAEGAGWEEVRRRGCGGGVAAAGLRL